MLFFFVPQAFSLPDPQALASEKRLAERCLGASRTATRAGAERDLRWSRSNARP